MSTRASDAYRAERERLLVKLDPHEIVAIDGGLWHLLDVFEQHTTDHTVTTDTARITKGPNHG